MNWDYMETLLLQPQLISVLSHPHFLQLCVCNNRILTHSLRFEIETFGISLTGANGVMALKSLSLYYTSI